MLVRGSTLPFIFCVFATGCSSSSSSNPNMQSTNGDDTSDAATSGGDDGSSSSTHDASSQGDATGSDASQSSDALAQDGGGSDASIGSGDGATLTGFENFCARSCAREGVCAATPDAAAYDVGACTANCDAMEANFVVYRDDYWPAVATCLEGASCLSILANSAQTPCETTAENTLTASATLAAFCTQLSSCPAGDQIQDCATDLAPYTDATINALSACVTSMGCDGTGTCVMTKL
jgi:hypothetical protein